MRKPTKRARDNVTVVDDYVLHPELARVASAIREAKKAPDLSMSCHSQREIWLSHVKPREPAPSAGAIRLRTLLHDGITLQV